MLFLDTAAILSYKRDEPATASYLDDRKPWFSSTICIYEFVNGAMWQDGLSAHVARQVPSLWSLTPIFRPTCSKTT